jgi:hypothetical protein
LTRSNVIETLSLARLAGLKEYKESGKEDWGDAATDNRFIGVRYTRVCSGVGIDSYKALISM